jgi:hypothetical protein
VVDSKLCAWMWAVLVDVVTRKSRKCGRRFD